MSVLSLFSIISGQAPVLKKLKTRVPKAAALPSNILQKTSSTTSMHSAHSHCSTPIFISDNEAVDNESSADGQSDGDMIELEVGLTPEEELSMFFNYYLIMYPNHIYIRGSPGTLALTNLHIQKLFFRNTMATGVISLPAWLLDAKYVLVGFVAFKIQRISRLLQTSHTMRFVVLV